MQGSNDNRLQYLNDTVPSVINAAHHYNIQFRIRNNGWNTIEYNQVYLELSIKICKQTWKFTSESDVISGGIGIWSGNLLISSADCGGKSTSTTVEYSLRKMGADSTFYEEWGNIPVTKTVQILL
eukprot:TRINITY_DN3143_c0_g3_i1.p1 TRINITY_DN3143_c0_g3~~TRINITY_DN3143_c0_g3_i1.p1  ORF type:complete len:125 (+),score=14.50 TRINITY_DN3143_c0_g3_i1:228-602(+)